MEIFPSFSLTSLPATGSHNSSYYYIHSWPFPSVNMSQWIVADSHITDESGFISTYQSFVKLRLYFLLYWVLSTSSLVVCEWRGLGEHRQRVMFGARLAMLSNCFLLHTQVWLLLMFGKPYVVLGWTRIASKQGMCLTALVCIFSPHLSDHLCSFLPLFGTEWLLLSAHAHLWDLMEFIKLFSAILDCLFFTLI